jgi:hypothetical protein
MSKEKDYLIRVCCVCGYILGEREVKIGMGGASHGIGDHCCEKLYGIKPKGEENGSSD